MKIYFEELSAPRRAGGIAAVTRDLVAHLGAAGLCVTRSSEQEAQRMPDCVHLHGIWSPRLAARLMAWRKQGVPCVVSPHGMLEPWSLAHKRVKKWMAWRLYQKRLLNQAALLHGTSEREVDQFRALGLKPPVACVPWGVALASQKQGSESSGERSQIRTALFVGRIYPVKGLPMLVKAWAQIRPTGWKLKIVGPDEAGHRAEVEALVKIMGLASAVEFAGELTGQAKATAYVQASLFVQPSYTENFGVAIAEALAHSLPVVTTTGTPWSVLPDKGCGWWVPPSVDHIAQALAAATSLDDESLRDMGRKGRRLVESEFGWPDAAAKMKAAYEWVVGTKPCPPFIRNL